jgi:hypothetical protein
MNKLSPRFSYVRVQRFIILIKEICKNQFILCNVKTMPVLQKAILKQVSRLRFRHQYQQKRLLH